jgi:hypothetical protein
MMKLILALKSIDGVEENLLKSQSHQSGKKCLQKSQKMENNAAEHMR